MTKHLRLLPRTLLTLVISLIASSPLVTASATFDVGGENGITEKFEGGGLNLARFADDSNNQSSAARDSASEEEDSGGIDATLPLSVPTFPFSGDEGYDATAGDEQPIGGDHASSLRSSVEATDACASHTTCDECASSSKFCHWCSDGACHASGSRFGCFRGETCDSSTPKPSPATPEPVPTPSPTPKPPEKNSSHCSAQSTCKDCSAETGCHWCHDEACHAIGSFHGCIRAESCDPPKPTPKKNDTSCAAQKTCSECSLSSFMCNWCAYDNQCHAKGSVHGCLSSVNCYSNSRCTRKGPEPIKRNVFGQIGMLPALAIVGAGMALLCCATACMSVVGCVAGTYDDLTGIMVAEVEDDGRRGYEPPEAEDNADADIDAVASEQVALMPPSSGESGDEECDEVDENEAEEDEGGDEEGVAEPLHIEEHNEVNEEANTQTSFLLWRSRTRRTRRRPRSRSDVARFYSGCKMCYAVTLVTVMTAVAASIIFFPKAPDFNVCNDQVAWKSIVDGMKSGKIQASFQLLMSVENPNRMSVEVDMGSGTFKHNGVEVGTFDIPTSTISAMSITDVLVAVTFTPDKWQALALSTEYYKGTLKFAVDATATVVIPSLAGYTFSGGIEDYIVHANDPKLQDRHLCVCPEWKDEKKKDGPGHTFADAMGLSAD
eukprot:CAMPEP_0113584836 /NCGR_PEP_ID=MMETSP0015_2-20120614/33329_1 /TAXON_ID=2838 /ORGANISM="Odontella" /LENGTH=661 /DNA_ID=CAMNT_0000489939 /DNA_START=53 /DNA_END=2038 /DNA_ORIENTATION=+ /assembly_acc=CAM_ASM_000160